ncbi:MAG: NUDIX hydrolase [Caldilineaceae bacterium]
MVAYQTSLDPQELLDLERHFGPTPHQQHTLTVHHPFLSGKHLWLTSNGRRAEICYVMHQGSPADGILLHIKTIYPENAYRLPTGGIHQGERVLETLTREIYEETGLIVGSQPNQVQVQRFLGITSYTMYHVEEARTHNFATYHFLVQKPLDAVLDPQDEDEMLADWRWVTPAQLSTVADVLETVGERSPYWSDWGKFRAISQRFVVEQLGKE